MEVVELGLLTVLRHQGQLVITSGPARSLRGGDRRQRRQLHGEAGSGAGRGLTKQGLKAGLFVGGKVSGLFTGVKSGLNEVGESFGDILAEAKADMATPKTKTSSQKA